MKKKIIEWFIDYPAAKWVLGSIASMWMAAALFANDFSPAYGFAAIFTGVVAMVMACATAG